MTEEIKFYPPSASAGGDNAHYLSGCETVGRSPAYASCLFKISELKAGRRPEIYRDCHNAIEARQCRAVDMREEEELKGQAIYFFPRRPPQLLTLPLSVAGDFGVRISNLTPPHMIPKDPKPTSSRFKPSVERTKPLTPPKMDALDKELLNATSNGFADAITSAVNELPKMEAITEVTLPAKEPAKPAPVIEPKLAPVAAAQPVARPAMLPGETPLQYARRLAASR